jgi:hypothetical protein
MVKRISIEYVGLDELKPYPNNPRDNRNAVESVKQSIINFGFKVPCVITDDGTIVTGHTRVTAMKQLRAQFPNDERFQEVPCILADDLTDEQVQAFRMVDNKTSELASWDFDRLSNEVSELVAAGVNLTPFGWTQEEIDCLANVVSADCLDGDGVNSAAYEGKSLATHRDNQSVRISIADLAFYVLREDYDRWADDMRREHNYDLDQMLDALADSMGLGEAKRRRTEFMARGAAAEEGQEVFDEDGDA